jgi:hypothetical protein
LGIAKAPSQKVKDYILELLDRAENSFSIPFAQRSKSAAAPLLYYYTKLHDTVFPNQQPRCEIHRYHYTD